ncbi:MAG TPA: tetratricopeptide repeat protein, partial [Urbifossiella sp.]|nr:tetratricopeptide repeat protein [Urbifossiella sp.]
SSYEDPQAEEKLAVAEALCAEGQYAAAADAFKKLADNTGNPATLAERARFMQGECLRMQSKYPDAVDTYHRLLMDFPTGSHRREACARMFEISDYWLDDFRAEIQTRTQAGETGVLHWRPSLVGFRDRTRPFIVEEGRALEALEHIHTHDVTGPTADTALFWCGYVNFVRGNFDEADHFFSQLVELHPESRWRPQAIAYAVQAKNNATGGAVYDGRKCAEALHLVQMAEASVPEITQDPAMAERMTRARFAIRYQQAEKDFETARFYERTGHPGSAVFYYELVRRRYPGTRYADLATERKDFLMRLIAEGRTPRGNDPVRILQGKWDELMGRPSQIQAEPRPADVPGGANAARGPVGPAGAQPPALPTGYNQP